MARPFRLRALEGLRRSKLATAARGLAQVRADLAAAIADRDRLRDELFVNGPATGLPDALVLAAARREALREDLARAGERISAVRSREISALAGWQSARADLRAVEMLHERHRLALAQEQARAEQRELDDLAGTRRPRPPEEET